jgi:hypothetical protein
MTPLRLRSLTIVAALAMLAAGLALWQNLAVVAPPRVENQLLLPGLSAHLADIAAIEVTAEGKSATVKHGDDGWILPQKEGYPAAPEKISRLLDRLAAMRLIEEKTADPVRYAALGLDTADKASTAVEVKLFNATGESLGDVIFGRRDPSMGRLGGGLYVRRAEGSGAGADAWLAEGLVDVPTTDIAFTEGMIFPPTDPQNIVSAEAREKNTTLFAIARAKDGKTLVLSPGKTTADQGKLLQFVATPAVLGFEDVRRLSGQGKPARIITFQRSDGVKDTLTLYPEGKDLWVAAGETGPDTDSFDAAHRDYLYRLDPARAAVLMKAPVDFAAEKSGKEKGGKKS